MTVGELRNILKNCDKNDTIVFNDNAEKPTEKYYITGKDIWDKIEPLIVKREKEAYKFKEMYKYGWYDAIELVEEILNNVYLKDGNLIIKE